MNGLFSLANLLFPTRLVFQPFLGALLGIGGSLLGALGGNKAKQREAQNQATQAQNDALARLYQTQQQAMLQALLGEEAGKLNRAGVDLQQRGFALNAPSTRAQQALYGSLLERLQPVRLTGLDPRIQARMPQITGGLSPEAIGPLARQFGNLLQKQVLLAQLQGDKFAPIPSTNFRSGLLPPPQLGQYKKPGTAESLLGLAGVGAQIAGGLLPRRTATIPTTGYRPPIAQLPAGLPGGF